MKKIGCMGLVLIFLGLAGAANADSINYTYPVNHENPSDEYDWPYMDPFGDSWLWASSSGGGSIRRAIGVKYRYGVFIGSPGDGGEDLDSLNPDVPDPGGDNPNGPGPDPDLDFPGFPPVGEDLKSVAPVPEPATMLLLGTGLAGLAVASRRKRRK